jgi:hypothetical protein
MAQDQDQPEGDPGGPIRTAADWTASQAEGEPRTLRRRWPWALGGVAVILLAAFAAVWLSRERIADNVLQGELDRLGLPATYEIEKIAPGEQVVRNLVIGDPARPDLTVEEVRIATELSWGLPGLGRITLVRPRLFGSVKDGKPSFGALDKVLFEGASDEPFTLPDLDIAIEDGGALIEADQGRIGVKLDGEGLLSGGFVGELAAVSPALSQAGCVAERPTLYGKLSVARARPHFSGPLRVAELRCPQQALSVRQLGAQLGLTVDEALDGVQGTASLSSGLAAYGEYSAQAAEGTLDATWRGGTFVAGYDLDAQAAKAPQANMNGIALTGHVRAVRGFARFDVDGEVSGTGIVPGPAISGTLDSVSRQGAGTPVGPVAAKIGDALAWDLRGGSVSATFVLRKTGDSISLILPEGTVRGRSGDSLVAVSRMQMFLGGSSLRLSGGFATGGENLPRIAGRMETGLRGTTALRIHMSPYAAGDARLAVPELALVQDASGDWGLAGHARLTGPLPDGRVEDLQLPIRGRISASGTVALWDNCTPVRFSSLRYANLSLERQQLTVCPPRSGAIVRYRPGAELRIAGGATSLALSGRIGETPVRLASGPIGFAWPGAVSARSIDVALGPPGTDSRFRISNLDAMLGADIGGTFEDADVMLAAVPLDLREVSGKWRYRGGALLLSEGSLRIEDREQVDRFLPMVARGADLTLRDNRITAHALVREPTSERQVLAATIVHDLGTGAGHADLDVPGLVFDRDLQISEVSPLLLGVVSNLEGTVTGTGRIDWNADGVTSSGRFASGDLDFAAPFGPVSDVSGTVVFTDLLGLVTAPDQHVAIGSVNPGIEATSGDLSFQLEPDLMLQVNGATWPFMGGTLKLLPTRMKMGASEARRMQFEIEALNAATLVQTMEIENVNVSGIFDGQLPIVFDERGGRIDGGTLVSRDPGGNVAYVGQLTYEDLSTMGNFAFQALRSVDYRQMTVGLAGSLDGEMITRITFAGVSQGTGAKRNFITRQIGKLPIRFVINIRAPFFGLVNSFRSLYDPSLVQDPRSLGLLDADGNPVENPVVTLPPSVVREAPDYPPPLPDAGAVPAVIPRSENIQPPDSEEQP